MTGKTNSTIILESDNYITGKVTPNPSDITPNGEYPISISVPFIPKFGVIKMEDISPEMEIHDLICIHEEGTILISDGVALATDPTNGNSIINCNYAMGKRVDFDGNILYVDILSSGQHTYHIYG